MSSTTKPQKDKTRKFTLTFTMLGTRRKKYKDLPYSPKYKYLKAKRANTCLLDIQMKISWIGALLSALQNLLTRCWCCRFRPMTNVSLLQITYAALYSMTGLIPYKFFETYMQVASCMPENLPDYISCIIAAYNTDCTTNASGVPPSF